MTIKHIVTATGVLLICLLPLQQSVAQRRGVKARGAEGRTHSPPRTRSAQLVSTSRCAMTVHQGLEFGGVTWDSAPGAIHHVEVNPVTGLRSMDIHTHAKGPRSVAGVIAVESESTPRITLSTTLPTQLSTGKAPGAPVAFTGAWAVSETATHGYEAVVGGAHVVAAARTGSARAYVRLGGRVTFAPAEISTPAEYRTQWTVNVVCS